MTEGFDDFPSDSRPAAICRKKHSLLPSGGVLASGCNSRIFSAAEEALQQLPIGQPCPIAQKHRPAKVLDDLTHLAVRHVPSWVAGASRPIKITGKGAI
jgi:hypothetical protein